jgi:hypothetical protein
MLLKMVAQYFRSMAQELLESRTVIYYIQLGSDLHERLSTANIIRTRLSGTGDYADKQMQAYAYGYVWAIAS